ncbi:hormogonium polysaccharide biosynthesis glycosyltransferase HpsO [cf. Phormidesmis sp. LEGE 11477]|uniref:hormogonium polysaccharide biosynthesis glycosyltransferase HpsO n=1 Tax=cf. Phormidesmis sp. LEGE 11477 TaxID=1828680 RepID=UPI001880BB8A|nr:glycosyltransferase family 4 protein [cf. Phormidesmis sp. LEGE 11477]
MKILVVSHTYIVDLNCEKLRSLVQIDPTVEVTVVVPKRWRPGGVQNKIIEPQAKHEGRFRVLPISNLSDNNQSLLSFGLDIYPLLEEFHPDIIQVEQGAKSIGYTELIMLNKVLKLAAKNVFFTWWNLPYDTQSLAAWIERYNLKNTHGLIAGNQDGVDILRDHGYGGPACVMPQLGVDERLFKPAAQPKLAAKHGISPGDFVVGFVGRFVPEKGLMILFEALAHLKTKLEERKPWKLLMLGRGPYQSALEKMAVELDIAEHILWIESVSHKQVPDYINLMDTLVLPSMTTYDISTFTAVGWKEQFGHVLIEAMACQVPVIGSDSGEIPNVIKEDGLVVSEGKPAPLAAGIQRLMNDPQHRQALAERGHIRAMTDYTNKALAKRQLEFYESLF